MLILNKNNKICLSFPIVSPSAEMQAMFKESIKNSYTISFVSWYTEWKAVNDGVEFQVDIGSAESINSPKNQIPAHQPLARVNVSDKANIIAVFDNLDVGTNFVEVDCYRYPRDAVITNYAKNEYLDQYGDLWLF